MNDIEIALEDLDTLVEIARQHTGIASWLGLVQSALIMKEALEKQLPKAKYNQNTQCGNCYATIQDTDNYCLNCGQKLKWED